MNWFDLQKFYGPAQYMSPDERNSASINGLINAAAAFTSPQAGRNPIGILAGGLGAYNQGVRSYGDAIPTQGNAWQQFNAKRELEKYFTPEKRQEVQQKYGISTPLTAEQAQELEMTVAANKATQDPLDDKLKEAQINSYNALANQRAAGGGGDMGAVGNVAIHLMKTNPEQFSDFGSAYYFALTGARQGQQFTGGQINPITGATDAAYAMANAKKSGELKATSAADIDKSLAEIKDVKASISRYQDTIANTDATGPIAGRVGDLVADPSRTNMISAQNELTLRAKSLLGMPSANFSDADRNFLQEIAGGKFARKEGLNQVAQRLVQMADDQEKKLVARKQGLIGTTASPTTNNTSGWNATPSGAKYKVVE